MHKPTCELFYSNVQKVLVFTTGLPFCVILFFLLICFNTFCFFDGWVSCGFLWWVFNGHFTVNRNFHSKFTKIWIISYKTLILIKIECFLTFLACFWLIWVRFWVVSSDSDFEHVPYVGRKLKGRQQETYLLSLTAQYHYLPQILLK